MNLGWEVENCDFDFQNFEVQNLKSKRGKTPYALLYSKSDYATKAKKAKYGKRETKIHTNKRSGMIDTKYTEKEK